MSPHAALHLSRPTKPSGGMGLIGGIANYLPSTQESVAFCAVPWFYVSTSQRHGTLPGMLDSVVIERARGYRNDH
jgi:hypothetical protein